MAYHNYGLRGNDVDNLWGGLIYSKVLNNLKELRAAVDPSTGYSYLGICDALEAYALLFLTDNFGDIPYSEALQGLDIPQPKFDTQQSILGVINDLLSSAAAHFAKSVSVVSPGSDDLVYGGDHNSWAKFVNALQARANLRTAKKDGNYQPVLDALSKGAFSAYGDGAAIKYGVASTANSPWFQYLEQRADVGLGVRYGELLNILQDPRQSTYGATLDDTHPILVPDQSLPFMNYTEQMFISAEAKIRLGDTTGAYVDYAEGIASSFTDAKLSQGDYNSYWANPLVNNGANNLTLDLIMTQKYMALFMNPEAHVDWRRTGIPTLTPHNGNQVPRRLPYPEQEFLYNSNCPSPSAVTLYTPVWWIIKI